LKRCADISLAIKTIQAPVRRQLGQNINFLILYRSKRNAAYKRLIFLTINGYCFEFEPIKQVGYLT
jgi:hypothetical protein